MGKGVCSVSLCSKEVLVVAGVCRVEHEETLEQRPALGCRAAVVVQHAQSHLGQQRHCRRHEEALWQCVSTTENQRGKKREQERV